MISSPLKTKDTFYFSLILLLVVTAVFFPVHTFEFINFDDNVYITDNPEVRAGLNKSSLIWAFTNSHGGHWHPLTWISHMIDCEFFGLSSGLHHLENVLWHAFNAVLVFIFINNLCKKRYLSFFVALIFAVHPLRLESVAWASERKDVLSLFFALCTIIAYQRFYQKKLLKHYLLSLIFFAIGLLAKPSIVIVPVLLLLLDFWPYKRQETLPKLVIEKLPFFLLSVFSGIATLYAQQADGALKSLAGYPIEARLSNAAISTVIYVAKLFWAKNLIIFYPFQVYPVYQGLAALCIICLITVVTLKVRHKYPYLVFSWFWFLVCLLPVIGLIQVGGQSHANRWTYLPHIGLITGLALFTYEKIRLKKFLLPLFLGCFLICLLSTKKQLSNWRDSKSVFSHALNVDPDNFMAHVNLGVVYENEQNLATAEYHYQQALLTRPDYSVALNNLGSVYAQTGRYDMAEPMFNRALNHNPTYSTARYNLGLLNAIKSRPSDAVKIWLPLVISDSSHADARVSLLSLINSVEASEICKDISIGSEYKKLKAMFLDWKKTTANNELVSSLSPLFNCY